MSTSPALLLIRTASTNENDHKNSIKIVSWIILALTVVVVIARQSIKALLLRRAAVDDFLILISTACVIGLSIIATLLASQGLSDSSLTIEQIHFLMKGYYVSNFMYIAAVCSAKLSVLVILYTIVEVQRWARRIVTAVSVFILAWSIASLLAIAFQCDIPRPWVMERTRCFNTQIFWVIRVANKQVKLLVKTGR
ncbi:hypothetical protein PTNB73_08954 [Pyrenophora teres f. teres]|uniref:Rhodopsin domain-containing protein n=1 Tax=Pyrenophora teres f. teres TaxID=97479 RepID=A0A6S6WJ41_9PLEO|nr:hypothetical protein HRS9139_09177 [Pyrenophora teres f. teres]KAE8855051.1 hypothetical protein PTNB29_09302 [Pyrenophora teres f. teres]KAE8857706.1 hypothetical protein PTNB73_08954 [Pyrenophora teres f. teres]CAE7212167.1 hypothetical protein PTTW11_10264 [Pyrenophora teres f. teres]